MKKENISFLRFNFYVVRYKGCALIRGRFSVCKVVCMAEIKGSISVSTFIETFTAQMFCNSCFYLLRIGSTLLWRTTNTKCGSKEKYIKAEIYESSHYARSRAFCISIALGICFRKFQLETKKIFFLLPPSHALPCLCAVSLSAAYCVRLLARNLCSPGI